MVSNPFQDGLAIQVSADTNQAQRALGGLTQSLGGTRGAALALGGVLAGAVVAGLAKSVQAAKEFETALVELQKVTSAAVAEDFRDDIMELSRTIPLSQEALTGLVADAARFGVAEENLTSFAEAAAKMSIATDISAERAGEAFARLAQLTDTPTDKVENLGSAINELSNNFATSSSEIVDSMLRSSAALNQFGLNQTQIVGMSAALNEVSESSRRAGTRLRRVAQELMNPNKVADIASALGLTVEEFKQMREESPEEVMLMLAEAFAEGGDAADNLRTSLSTASRQAVAGMAQNLDGLREALDKSERAFEDNTSLQREFEAASDTLDKRMQILNNRVNELAIGIGTALIPTVKNAVDALINLTDAAIELGDAGVRAFDRLTRASREWLKENQIAARGWRDIVADARAAEDAARDFAGAVSESLQRSEVQRIQQAAGAYDAVAQSASKAKSETEKAAGAFKDFVTIVSPTGGIFEVARGETEPKDISGTIGSAREIRNALQGIGANFRQVAGGGGRNRPPAVQVETDTNVDVQIQGTDELTRAIAESAEIVIETRERRADRLNGRTGF